MPIYEYVCNQCGHQFELLVRSQEEKLACPECGRSRLTKLLSVPAAHTGSSQPACPAREMGSCGVPNCHGGSGGCGMAEWMK